MEDVAEGARGGSIRTMSASSDDINDGDSSAVILLDANTNARNVPTNEAMDLHDETTDTGGDFEVEDILSEGTSLFRPRTLFLNNLGFFDIGRTPTYKLLGEIQKTVRFEKGSRVRNSLKIIFFDEDTAKFFAENPIPFFGKDAHLQRPKGYGGDTPEWITQTLHIYGLPFEVNMKSLGDYLKENGMEPGMRAGL